jgi:colanic acid biosynthesis glycosyl transferase WcaI
MDERLKILYISHYFPPEVNAPAVRVSEMARRWTDSGADVTVLTCFPNHPAGIIPEEYRGLLRSQEKRGATKIVRTYVYAAANKGFLKRIINFLSFMFSAILLGTPVVGKPDILIATSPQFFVAVAGYVISRLKRCKFVFEIRDLWPEEIVAVGALKNKLAIKFLETIEMFLYRKADLIVAVAEGTIEILKQRGIPISKMALVPNGVDVDLFSRCAGGDDVRRELGLDGKFVAGYIGTHGMAHKLGTVLEAANLLKDHDDIRFLFVGDGADKKNLQIQAKDMGLNNVVFQPQIPRSRVAEFYSACNACLVPLRKADLFTKNIPSKIYEIMASSRPIIISTEGESRRLVEMSGAGLGSRPEDPQGMAEKILYLRDNSVLCREMGQSGYSFALANSSRTRLADNYLNLLMKNVKAKTALVQNQGNQIEIKVEDINRKKRESVSV